MSAVQSSVTLASLDSQSGDIEKGLDCTSTSSISTSTRSSGFGLDGWRIVAASWMLQFVTLGSTSAFGVYQDYYGRERLPEYSASAISWIGSTQSFMLYAVSIMAGRLFDTGYFRHILILGSLIQVLCIFMLSITEQGQYWQIFVAQGLGLGLGQGLVYVPSMSIIGHHFSRNRALATGLAVTGASVGAVVWPIMLNELIRRTSFASAVRAAGGLTAGLLLVANVVMKLRVVSDASLQDMQEKPVVDAFWPTLKRIVRDSPYILFLIGACLVTLGIFVPNFYLQSYALDQGIDPNMAFYILSIMNAGTLLGRIIPALIADRYGSYNVMIPSQLGCGLLIFALLGASSLGSVVTLAVLFGIVSGAQSAVIPSVIGQLAGGVEDLGTRMGLTFSVTSTMTLVGAPIAGSLLGSNSVSSNTEWPQMFIYAGVIVVSGSIGMLFSRWRFVETGRSKERGRWV